VFQGPIQNSTILDNLLKDLGLKTIPDVAAATENLGNQMRTLRDLKAQGVVFDPAVWDALIVQINKANAELNKMGGGFFSTGFQSAIDPDADREAYEDMLAARIAADEQWSETRRNNILEQRREDIRTAFMFRRLKVIEDFKKAELNLERKAAIQQVQLQNTVAQGAIAAAAALFGQSKSLAIASAIMNTYEAVTAALKSPPYPPLSIPQAVAAGLFGLAQVANIRSTGMQAGGFVPGPRGAGDIVPTLLSPGELVLNEQQQSQLFGGAQPITLELEIGPNLRQWADDVSVRVRRGAVRLVASELVGQRTVRA
jgi:hypothetical protein